MSVLPGPIRQIGYVVTDLDRAIASWVELGVGRAKFIRDAAANWDGSDPLRVRRLTLRRNCIPAGLLLGLSLLDTVSAISYLPRFITLSAAGPVLVGHPQPANAATASWWRRPS